MTIMGSIILYVGLLLLSLSLEKHYKQIFNTPFTLGFKRSVTFFGWALLFISIALYIHRFGVGLGITYWLGVVTPLIITIGLLFTYAAPHMLKLSIVFASLALIVGVYLF